MVSNASEDFPEPDRPVNTTSLSRGISRSTFLRLCSRAPRMVMARIAEPVCWRLAFRISSMIGNSRRVDSATRGRASPDKRDLPPYGWSPRNVGRTRADFQCCVDAINGLLRLGLRGFRNRESARKILASRQLG